MSEHPEINIIPPIEVDAEGTVTFTVSVSNADHWHYRWKYTDGSWIPEFPIMVTDGSSTASFVVSETGNYTLVVYAVNDHHMALDEDSQEFPYISSTSPSPTPASSSSPTPASSPSPTPASSSSPTPASSPSPTPASSSSPTPLSSPSPTPASSSSPTPLSSPSPSPSPSPTPLSSPSPSPSPSPTPASSPSPSPSPSPTPASSPSPVSSSPSPVSSSPSPVSSSPSPVSSSPSPTPVECNDDTQACPDGTFVGRDLNNGCEFFDCPVFTNKYESCGDLIGGQVLYAYPNVPNPPSNISTSNCNNSRLCYSHVGRIYGSQQGHSNYNTEFVCGDVQCQFEHEYKQCEYDPTESYSTRYGYGNVCAPPSFVKDTSGQCWKWQSTRLSTSPNTETSWVQEVVSGCNAVDSCCSSKGWCPDGCSANSSSSLVECVNTIHPDYEPIILGQPIGHGQAQKDYADLKIKISVENMLNGADYQYVYVEGVGEDIDGLFVLSTDSIVPTSEGYVEPTYNEIKIYDRGTRSDNIPGLGWQPVSTIDHGSDKWRYEKADNPDYYITLDFTGRPGHNEVTFLHYMEDFQKIFGIEPFILAKWTLWGPDGESGYLEEASAEGPINSHPSTAVWPEHIKVGLVDCFSIPRILLSEGQIINITVGDSGTVQTAEPTNLGVCHYMWSADPFQGLPDGLSINQATGEISGSPTTPGTYVTELEAKNRCGNTSGKINVTFVIQPSPTEDSYESSDGGVELKSSCDSGMEDESSHITGDQTNIPQSDDLFEEERPDPVPGFVKTKHIGHSSMFTDDLTAMFSIFEDAAENPCDRITSIGVTGNSFPRNTSVYAEFEMTFENYGWEVAGSIPNDTCNYQCTDWLSEILNQGNFVSCADEFAYGIPLSTASLGGKFFGWLVKLEPKESDDVDTNSYGVATVRLAVDIFSSGTAANEYYMSLLDNQQPIYLSLVHPGRKFTDWGDRDICVTWGASDFNLSSYCYSAPHIANTPNHCVQHIKFEPVSPVSAYYTGYSITCDTVRAVDEVEFTGEVDKPLSARQVTMPVELSEEEQWVVPVNPSYDNLRIVGDDGKFIDDDGEDDTSKYVVVGDQAYPLTLKIENPNSRVVRVRLSADDNVGDFDVSSILFVEDSTKKISAMSDVWLNPYESKTQMIYGLGTKLKVETFHGCWEDQFDCTGTPNMPSGSEATEQESRILDLSSYSNINVGEYSEHTNVPNFQNVDLSVRLIDLTDWKTISVSVDWSGEVCLESMNISSSVSKDECVDAQGTYTLKLYNNDNLIATEQLVQLDGVVDTGKVSVEMTLV